MVTVDLEGLYQFLGGCKPWDFARAKVMDEQIDVMLIARESKTYQLDIDQLILLARNNILAPPDMRHVAPVIRPVLFIRRDRRVVDKPINTSRLGADHISKVVDERLRRLVPAQIDPRSRVRHAQAAARAHPAVDHTALALDLTAGEAPAQKTRRLGKHEGRDVCSQDECNEEQAAERQNDQPGRAREALDAPEGIHPLLMSTGCRSPTCVRERPSARRLVRGEGEEVRGSTADARMRYAVVGH